MIENAQKMRCGGCGESSVTMYRAADRRGQFIYIAECSGCKSTTAIAPTVPSLTLTWEGSGGLAVF